VLPTRSEQEYQLLKFIDEHGQPVGSGSVAEFLRAMGFDLSEATAGRLLRELDLRGLSVRLGYRGRVLTDEGRAHLRDLAAERRRSGFGQEFLRVLRAPEVSDLVDVLVARRAIERETARLAALHADEATIAELYEIVRQHEQGHQGPEHDVRFHRLIARASRNRVLSAAVDLIHQDGLLSPVLDYIRKWARSTIASDHRQIVESLARGSAEGAERAMVAHIENVIRDVKRYGDTVKGESEGEVVS
jgi:GntR family L-lactate dehydrogenase operon transcriptional regulator